VIAVYILASAAHPVAVIRDCERLEIGIERRLGEVGTASSPLDSAGGLVRGASSPGAKLHLHGSLRV